MILACMLALAGVVDQGAAEWTKGDLPAAIAIWEPPVDNGWGSGRVKFNLGNAYYRKGDLPRAIAYWRAAGVLRPRTQGVHHNLALARSELSRVPTPAGSSWLWMQVLTPGELSILGLILAAFAVVMLLARLRQRERGSLLPAAALWSLGAAMVLLAAWGWWVQTSRPLAVVVDAPAVVRDGPDLTASMRFDLPPGSEVAVVLRARDFLLIETGEGNRGWVPDGAVLQVSR